MFIEEETTTDKVRDKRSKGPGSLYSMVLFIDFRHSKESSSVAEFYRTLERFRRFSHDCVSIMVLSLGNLRLFSFCRIFS